MTDLKKEDFALTDNGEQKKLTDFERHDLKRSGPAGNPAGTKIAAVSPPIPRLLNRKIIFLFDFASGDYFGARKAAEAALHFLDTKVLPGDEIAVMTYSAIRMLQVQEFLTADYKKIRSIISSFGLHSGSENALDSSEKYAQQLESGASPDARQANPLTMDGSRDLPPELTGGMALIGEGRGRMRTYFDKMTALAQALRYVPGQKILILFSGGITGTQLVIAGDPRKRGLELNTEMRRRFDDLLQEMATSNIALFPINTDGMTAASEQRSGAVALREMAASTGGQYFGYAQNYADHFKKIQTLTGTFYVLGYPIHEIWDGKYHKIKVSVSRPGCEVRAQAGYLNPKEFADYTDFEKKIHLVDLALAETPLLQNPIRFSMAALGLSDIPGGNIGIAAEIPLAALRDGGMGRVEILRLAFDAADEIVDSRRTEEDLRERKEPTAVLASLLSAPAGRIRCRIIIRDVETGKAAVAGTTMIVPGAAETEVRILPPLFLRPEKGNIVIEEAKPAKTKVPTLPTPAKAFFMDPAQYIPDFSTTLKNRSEVRAVISCTGPRDALAGTKITLTLLDKFKNETREIPLSLMGEKESRGARIFFVRFQIPDLEPDEYSLIFAASGLQGPVSRIVRDFTIE